MSKPQCNQFGRRMKIYPKCKDCSEEVLTECCVETLQFVLKRDGCKRKVEVLLPTGEKKLVYEPKRR